MQFLITSFEIFVCFSLLLPLVLETFKILCSRVVSNRLSHAHTISNNIPFIICRFGATWRFPIQREKWLISIDCYGTCNTSHLKSLILEFQEKSSYNNSNCSLIITPNQFWTKAGTLQTQHLVTIVLKIKIA